MKSALIFAAVVCVSMALPPRGVGDRLPEDGPRAVRVFSMSIAVTTVVGQCELYFKTIAEETGNEIGDVPEDMQGVLYAICPKLAKLTEGKTEEQVRQVFVDMVRFLPLVQCASLVGQKESVEWFFGLDNSQFLQTAQPVIDQCVSVFADLALELELELEGEMYNMGATKRSGHFLKAYLDRVMVK